MMEHQRYWLAGAPTTPWLTKRKIVTTGVLGMLAIVLLAVVMVTQSLLLTLAMFAAIGGIVALWMRRDDEGGRIVSEFVSRHLRTLLARQGRWDEFDPDVDFRPFWLEKTHLYAVSGDASSAELGLVVDNTHMVAVLEVDGGGQGIQSVTALARRERALQGVLKACAAPRSTVEQLDFITRCAPVDAADVDVNSQLVQWVTPAIRTSMNQLADQAQDTAQQVQSWIAIRMSMSQLAEKARELGIDPNPEVMAEAAFDTVGQVTRHLTDHGIAVHRGLSPRRLGAVVRGILLPDFSVDDTEGLDEFWDAWPAYAPTDRGEALAVFDADSTHADWFHAAGSIPRRGWPDQTVVGRWLAPLLLTDRVPHRVVMTSLSLIPPRRAHQMALDQLTTAASRRIRKRNSQQVSTGEEALEESSARTVGEDISVRSQAGVRVVTRVMVSAKSRRTLRRAREEAESIMEQGMGVTEVWWDDHRQAVGVLNTLPLGWGQRHE